MSEFDVRSGRARTAEDYLAYEVAGKRPTEKMDEAFRRYEARKERELIESFPPGSFGREALRIVRRDDIRPSAESLEEIAMDRQAELRAADERRERRGRRAATIRSGSSFYRPLGGGRFEEVSLR